MLAGINETASVLHDQIIMIGVTIWSDYIVERYESETVFVPTPNASRFRANFSGNGLRWQR
jgi:hypothetical protein